MANLQIHCSVEECVHNNNMRCTADTIRVRSRSNAGAFSSEDTHCETFKPRH